jgi:hypothetical protein
MLLKGPFLNSPLEMNGTEKSAQLQKMMDYIIIVEKKKSAKSAGLHSQSKEKNA